jgi:OCT family organic cation transporter-like MFS transporter 4/5
MITFAMIGKMCITASYGVIYIFTAESFPTVVRNGGVGASSMFARVGGIVANSLLILVKLSIVVHTKSTLKISFATIQSLHTIQFQGDFWKPLPLLIFGAASLTAGFLALLIPETFGKRLPETMEDGENFGL